MFVRNRELEFGPIDELEFGQLQFDHPLACGFVDSLQERSLGIFQTWLSLVSAFETRRILGAVTRPFYHGKLRFRGYVSLQFPTLNFPR